MSWGLNSVLLCSADWPGIYCAAQAGFQPTVFFFGLLNAWITGEPIPYVLSLSEKKKKKVVSELRVIEYVPIMHEAKTLFVELLPLVT